MIMKTHIQLDLSDMIGVCSGGLGSILEKNYKLQTSELDKAILENYGFILAYLCIQGGLSLNEAGSTIACFVGVNCGIDTEKLYFIAHAMQFYYKHLKIYEDNQKNILYPSVIVYNLCRPGTWDDFNDNLHIEECNLFQIVELWTNIQCFVKDELPQKINPLLNKIDSHETEI